MEKIAVGDDEFVTVRVFDMKLLAVEAKEILQLGSDFVANAAHGDWFHGE